MNDSERDWKKAIERFVRLRQLHRELAASGGVEESRKLQLTFEPLAVRFNRGERSKDLYDLMMSVE